MLEHPPAALPASPPLCQKRRGFWHPAHRIQALGRPVEQAQPLFRLERCPTRLRAQPIPPTDPIHGRRPLGWLPYLLPARVREASPVPYLPLAWLTRLDQLPQPPTRSEEHTSELQSP